jgi:hypothetical protein
MRVRLHRTKQKHGWVIPSVWELPTNGLHPTTYRSTFQRFCASQNIFVVNLSGSVAGEAEVLGCLLSD